MSKKKSPVQTAKKGNRWYDLFPDFSERLESLKNLDQKELDKILMGMMYITQKYEATLVGGSAIKAHQRRRWYEKDFYAWLLINSLEHSKDATVEKLNEYLKIALKDPIKNWREAMKF